MKMAEFEGIIMTYHLSKLTFYCTQV